tara:strand:+ start:619 stop:1605 length:987 start_codon:yes stop_codon:yes gene_type:complete
LKILVVGYGSIAKRHIENLLKIPDIEILVYSSVRKHARTHNKCEFFKNIRDAIKEKPDAAIICSVTSRHIQNSLVLANSGIHLLIEKPLSNTLSNTEHLQKITKNKKLVTLIGCNLRFHPCIQKIKKLLDDKTIGKIFFIRAEHASYLPDWHPNEKYENSYAAKKNLGGGVLLTSIHEIDYLYWLFGMPKDIFSVTEKISNLKVTADDFSSLLLHFKNKIVAEIHLNFFQKSLSRGCKIVGSKGIIQWDYTTNSVKLYNYKNNRWKNILLLKKFDINQTYIDELNHFIKCLKNQEKSLNPICDGINTLKIALNAKKSSKTKRVVKLNE